MNLSKRQILSYVANVLFIDSARLDSRLDSTRLERKVSLDDLRLTCDTSNNGTDVEVAETNRVSPTNSPRVAGVELFRQDTDTLSNCNYVIIKGGRKAR